MSNPDQSNARQVILDLLDHCRTLAEGAGEGEIAELINEAVLQCRTVHMLKLEAFATSPRRGTGQS